MRYILAAALGAGLTAGAAQAAFYQYDVTMELQSLRVFDLYGYNTDVPDPLPEGIGCQSVQDAHVCEGTADFTNNRYDLGFLQEYTPVISGTFTLDTDYGPSWQENDGLPPQCSGSIVLCRAVNWSGEAFGYSASSEGFYIQPFTEWLSFSLDEDGLSYEDDVEYVFSLGNTQYNNAGGGLWLSTRQPA